VALVYCTKHANKVRTLTLTGSSGLYENAFGGSFPRREDKEYLRKKIALTFHDPKHATDDLVEECYVTVNDKAKLIRILSLAKSAIRHNMAKDLPNLKMPVCLIWGAQDTITPPHVAEEFHPHPTERTVLDRQLRSRRHDGAPGHLQRYRGPLAGQDTWIGIRAPGSSMHPLDRVVGTAWTP
jgi:pimeloyl-ACP methyl ester carboxylesterase